MFRDSSKALLAGLMWAIITVRLFPPQGVLDGPGAGGGQQGLPPWTLLPLVMPSWRVCVSLSHTLTGAGAEHPVDPPAPSAASPLLPSPSFFSKAHVRKFPASESGPPSSPPPLLIYMRTRKGWLEPEREEL